MLNYILYRIDGPWLESLRAIPGPNFLLLYFIYLFAGFWALRYLRHQNFAIYSKPIHPAQLNPYEVAWLQKGKDGLADLLLFELWSANLLRNDIASSGRQLKTQKRPQNPPPLSELAQASFTTLLNPQTYDAFTKWLSKNPLIPKLMARVIQHKLCYFEHSNFGALVGLIGSTLLLAPGLVKLLLGLQFDKPVFGLCVELFFGFMAAWATWTSSCNPEPATTPRGRKLVEELQLNNRWLKDEYRSQFNSSNDSKLAVALFGYSATGSMAAYADFYTLAQQVDPARRYMKNNGGDGGSSGSSDSSSGCGGGGCGGCGGGGGCGG